MAKLKLVHSKAEEWTRLKGEGKQEYALFCEYLRRGIRREIYPMARELGVNGDSVYVMSGKYQWKRRAAAYDEYIDDAEANGDGGRQAKAMESIVYSMMDLLRRDLELWHKKMDLAEDMSEPMLSPGDIKGMADGVFKMKQLIDGKATENIDLLSGLGGGVDFGDESVRNAADNFTIAVDNSKKVAK
jgi:hypothetical protein